LIAFTLVVLVVVKSVSVFTMGFRPVIRIVHQLPCEPIMNVLATGFAREGPESEAKLPGRDIEA
jgi:hypothetical protein